MKIVAVNVCESHIEDMKRLTGEGGIYPSRSELIRCAVRAFLIKEFKLDRKTQKEKIREYNKNNHDSVIIPLSNGEFKTYKIKK